LYQLRQVDEVHVIGLLELLVYETNTASIGFPIEELHHVLESKLADLFGIDNRNSFLALAFVLSLLLFD